MITDDEIRAIARKVEHEHYRWDDVTFARAVLKAEPVQEPVRYEYRWLNPGNNPGDHCEAEWTLVEPRNPHMDTVQDRIAELEAYRYDGKPVYEVRALYAAAPQAKAESARPQNCGSGHCSCVECVVDKEDTK